MTPTMHDHGGDGPDVLLLHGGADNLETWREFAPLLDGLRVVAYDALGHGRSPTPDRASVDDLVDEVLTMASRLDRPLLVGHSMGGVNALLAAGRTDDLKGVVALDAVPRWWIRPSLTMSDLIEIGQSRGLGWTGTPEDLRLEAARLAEGSRHAGLIRAIFQRNHELNGDGLLSRKPEPAYALTLAQLYIGPESGLTQERIEAARCPVLMLCSEQWVDGDEARRTLADLTVDVEWLDASHYLHWDEPEAIARCVRELACAS